MEYMAPHFSVTDNDPFMYDIALQPLVVLLLLFISYTRYNKI